MGYYVGGPILAGLAAGATNAALSGGNIAVGALLGGIAGGIGPPLFTAFGGDVAAGFTWGNFVAVAGSATVTGAVVGGISTAFYGGNFWQNVFVGGITSGIMAGVSYGVAYGATQVWEGLQTIGQSGKVGCCDRVITPSEQTQDVRFISDEGEGRSNPLVDSLIKNAEKLALTGTVAGKALSEPRPYAFLTQVMQEIMAARGPVPDTFVPGALRWDVLGTFAGKLGVWELVVNPQTQQVLHFLFNTDKSAVAPFLK